MLDRFGQDLRSMATALDDLADPDAQGAQAYADEMSRNHAEIAHRVHAADGVAAVLACVERLDLR